MELRNRLELQHSNLFRNIITCGTNDGDIRIWREISDDDTTSFCIGETAISCAHYTHIDSKQRLIASTDNNTVQCFTFPQGDRDGLLMRFTAPVTTIKVNKKVSLQLIHRCRCLHKHFFLSGSLLDRKTSRSKSKSEKQPTNTRS